MNKRTSYIWACLLLILPIAAEAQDFSFSQYHNTPMLTNPAMLGAQDGINIGMNYRNQRLRSGQSLATPMFNLTYPMFNASSRQNATIGVTLLNNNSGNFMITNGVLVAGAYNVQLGEKSTLSLGLQGGVFQRRIDADELSTATQFMDGVFNPGMPNGETISSQTGSFPTFGGGAYWFMPGDDQGSRPKAFFGVSVLNINQPTNSFFETAVEENTVPARLQITGGFTVIKLNKLSITPNVRFTSVSDNRVTNLGTWLTYNLSNNGNPTQVSIGGWYNTNEFGTLSIEFEDKSVMAALSFDVPFSDDANTFQNNGIIELTMGVKIARSKNESKSNE